MDDLFINNIAAKVNVCKAMAIKEIATVMGDEMINEQSRLRQRLDLNNKQVVELLLFVKGMYEAGVRSMYSVVERTYPELEPYQYKISVDVDEKKEEVIIRCYDIGGRKDASNDE